MFFPADRFPELSRRTHHLASGVFSAPNPTLANSRSHVNRNGTNRNRHFERIQQAHHKKDIPSARKKILSYRYRSLVAPLHSNLRGFVFFLIPPCRALVGSHHVRDTAHAVGHGAHFERGDGARESVQEIFIPSACIAGQRATASAAKRGKSTKIGQRPLLEAVGLSFKYRALSLLMRSRAESMLVPVSGIPKS